MSTSGNLDHIEDFATTRWLAAMLAPAQRRVREAPTADAVDRIRAQVFGASARGKGTRSIAA